jgi:Tfp pilus assembly protein PilE
MSAAGTDLPSHRSRRLGGVELVVSIVVLGILATIALPACGEYLALGGHEDAQVVMADLHAWGERLSRNASAPVSRGGPCGVLSIIECVDAFSARIAAVGRSSVNADAAPASSAPLGATCCAVAGRRSPIVSLQKRF